MTNQNEKIINFKFILLILFIYLLILFKFYSGNHHSVYLSAWKYVLGITNFSYDIFVQNTNQINLSILYKIFGNLGINLDNDYIGFFIHIVFISISLFYFLKIINFYYDIDFEKSLIILFSLTFIGNVIIIGNLSTWIVSVNATPTYFVHCLIPFLIWSTLSEKYKTVFFTSTIMILSGLKACWFIIGVLWVYCFFYQRKINSLWIVGPILALLYLFLNTSTDINSIEDRYFFWDIVLEGDHLEVAFHRQPNINIIFLVASFVIFYFILQIIKKEKIYNFLKILLYLSILNFVFFYFYGIYGKQIYPEPRLLAMSGTRALGIYELFFFLTLLFSFFLKTNIQYRNKILFLAIFFYLSMTSFKTLIIIFSIIIFHIFIIKAKLYQKHKNFFDRYLFYIFILPGIIYLFYKSVLMFDTYGLRTINKWTTGLVNHPKRMENLVKLKNCNDFLFFSRLKSSYSSSIAEKSSYNGYVWFNHFNYQIAKTSRKRQEIIFKIDQLIEKKKKIPDELLNDFYQNELIVIIPENEKSFYPRNIKFYRFSNGEFLLSFMKEENFNNIFDSCLNNL